MMSANGKPRIPSHGMYLTIWRRDDEGGWKVVEDIGAPAAEE